MALAEVLSRKGLPANLLAERAVLGAILLDTYAFNIAAEILTPDDFHLESHTKIFRAMRELQQSATALDYITLSTALEQARDLEAVGGTAYLVTLTDGLPRNLNIEQYAHIVRDRSLLRQLLAAGQSIVTDCLDASLTSNMILERAESGILRIADDRIKEGLTDAGALALPMLQKLQEQHGQQITGLSTGYATLDDLTTGLQPADLIIIAGRPSMGKTALAINIVENSALRRQATAAVFSLEMAKSQLVLRMLCSTARVDAGDVRRRFLGRKQIESLGEAARRLADAHIFIDDSAGLDVPTMRAKCRRLQHELKSKGQTLDLVVVDYLQLMSAGEPGENRNQEVTAISRGLKMLAKELSVPLIALSQLSRAPEQRKGEPILSDLRESGAIEQDADLVLFIHREDFYNADINPDQKGKAKIIVAKQRNGPTGAFHLAFLRHFTRFEELAAGEE